VEKFHFSSCPVNRASFKASYIVYIIIIYIIILSPSLGYILKRVDNMKVFSLMFFGFAVRFFLYSIITNPAYVLPVEFFNGLTYALAYSAATSYASVLAPVGAEGTLQGIVGTAFMGIGM